MAVLALPLIAAAFTSAAGITGIAASVIGLGASIAGSMIDSLLFPPKPQIIKQEGPRLTQQQVTTSTEGSPVKRMWGRSRIGGQVIWSTRFREEVVTTTTTTRTGKSGRRQEVQNTQTIYNYYVSFALALCEGPVSQIGRIWADGKLLDPSLYTIRFYLGTDDQLPDPKIEAVEGTGKTPAYRGIVYIVFDEMKLDKFGNRIPQITAEVIRPLAVAGENTELIAKAINLYTVGEFDPGTTNFTQSISGVSSSMNFTNDRNLPSIKATMDDLESVFSNANTIDMRVPWYGNDLRCQQCRIRPKVETTSRTVVPSDWVVSGLTRANIASLATPSDHILTTFEGRFYYPATPTDLAVKEGIAELKARGHKVSFTPVLDLDIPVGNTTPNPYGGSSTDPYPSRKKITCNPAIGIGGTVDETASAATQVAWFFGDAQGYHFGSWTGTTIPFSGDPQWSYRRFVLHYAAICAAAGGVDYFNIGAGLATLTKIRGAPSSGVATFPTVTEMLSLMTAVRGILPNAKVSYAADWTEWNGYSPAEFSSNPTMADLTKTFYHHLDPLWVASDYVGIEWFPPLTDWRDIGVNEDADEGIIKNEYDPFYLNLNMTGGEYFDYIYRTDSARTNQIRTQITDESGEGEDWMFRRKDIKSWWTNNHRNRVDNVLSTVTTSWSPKSKQIRFTAVGAPAIDKSSNGPDLPYPPFSTQARDDAAQRSYIEAVLKWTQDRIVNPEFITGSGPRMVDHELVFVHFWDVRPFPVFPNNATLYGDSKKYEKGMWLNGRVGSPALVALVSGVMENTGVAFDTTGLYGGNTMVQGYVVDQIASTRELLAALEACFFFDAIEVEGSIRFALRNNKSVTTVDPNSLLSTEDDPGGFELSRMQETDLPSSVKFQYIDPEKDFQVGAVDARRLVGKSGHTETVMYPLVLDTFYAKIIADAFLQEAWMKRETLKMNMPPSMVEFDAGDVIEFDHGIGSRLFRIQKVTTGYGRTVEAFSYDPSVYPSTR